MPTPLKVPFDWIRYLEKALLQHDEIPLLGSPVPSFDWDRFAVDLAKTFEIQELKITPTEWCWRVHEELFTGLGEPLYPVRLNLAPLSGSAWWLMNENDVAQLMAWVVAKQTIPLPIIEKDYQGAFYRVVLLEAVHNYKLQNPDSAINPSFMLTQERPTGESLCLDLNFSFQNQSLWGRLVLSSDLRKAWKEYHVHQQTVRSPAPLAQDLEVILCLEGGSVTLSMEEWSGVVPGDFIVLDRCSVDPTADKQRVVLTVNGVPMFRGRLKKGKLKIVDYPLYNEVDTSMVKDIDDVSEEEDFSFEEDEDNEFEAFDEHEEEEEFEEEPEIENKAAAAKPQASAQATAPVPAAQETAPAPQAQAIQAGDIPLQLTVEVARVSMTVQMLMNLQPGNLLELNVHPEQGVDLVVNGKKIGRAELLKIGDVLGVRILEIG